MRMYRELTIEGPCACTASAASIWCLSVSFWSLILQEGSWLKLTSSVLVYVLQNFICRHKPNFHQKITPSCYYIATLLTITLANIFKRKTISKSKQGNDRQQIPISQDQILSISSHFLLWQSGRPRASRGSSKHEQLARQLLCRKRFRRFSCPQADHRIMLFVERKSMWQIWNKVQFL